MPAQEPILQRIHPIIRPWLDSGTTVAHGQDTDSHATVETLPGRFKRRLMIESLQHPWQGLSHLETRALLAAELAEARKPDLSAILALLETSFDRPPNHYKPIPLPTGSSPKDFVDFMVTNLEQAAKLRDQALVLLSSSERRFLFKHAHVLTEHFTPQISVWTEQTASQTEALGRFAELIDQRMDYAALIASAQTLVGLADERWVRHLAAVFPKSLPPTEIPHGITGDVRLVHHTAYGLIVIGGPGPNNYELDGRFALVIDLGGDDLYQGLIGASASEEQGNMAVIDLEGNDTYIAAPLGLGTGRLGVGLVIDHAGDDVYHLQSGGGGVGFAGLGILFDAKGHDTYQGERLTQGAAIGGLGLLLDLAGNDRYTGQGFAMGFGGPLGIGALIDETGNDQYDCTNGLPSAYNAQDAPQAKPGDPSFQYDCFGLGTGSGFRLLSKRPDRQAYSLAGGWGLLLDATGNDQYRSANFSQGLGYFFGVGTLIDLEGADEYRAARYGQGASAHHGVALFLDRQGDDQYYSTGPFYNVGVAWDESVGMAIDAGTGRDRYNLDQSTGLGTADYGGWAMFLDEGGEDQYNIKSGFGEAGKQSLAWFFDLDGTDEYTPLPPPLAFKPLNSIVTHRSLHGLFIDR